MSGNHIFGDITLLRFVASLERLGSIDVARDRVDASWRKNIAACGTEDQLSTSCRSHCRASVRWRSRAGPAQRGGFEAMRVGTVSGVIFKERLLGTQPIELLCSYAQMYTIRFGASRGFRFDFGLDRCEAAAAISRGREPTECNFARPRAAQRRHPRQCRRCAAGSFRSAEIRGLAPRPYHFAASRLSNFDTFPREPLVQKAWPEGRPSSPSVIRNRLPKTDLRLLPTGRRSVFADAEFGGN
jgi:hypothetical protein